MTAAFAERVADFVSSTTFDRLPDRDIAAVDRSVFDTVGTMLAGRTSAVGEIVTGYAATQPDSAFTVLGTGLRKSAPTAAFANGVFAHADDFDDMGGYGHPSAPLVAALLTAAEMERRAGRPVAGSELVAAYAVGFEVGVTLCSMGAYDQYERCFHSTPVFGALAGACAVSRLFGLDSAGVANALGIAASDAAGLGRSSGTMVKPVHAGQAARTAVVAAAAARNGATAAADVFEARGGFMHAMFGHRALPLDAMADALGNPFKVDSTIFIKRFPCCGSNHSALSALERILDEHDVAADEVSEVIVHGMTETSPVLRFPVPETGTSAKFSIQYVLGTMLVKRAVRLDDFRDAAISDQAVLQVAARVEPEVMNRWDLRGAAKHRGNPLTIRTVDGRELKAAVARTEMVGGPRAPLPEESLRGKFLNNAALSIGTDRGEAAAESWRHVSGHSDVASLLEAVA